MVDLMSRRVKWKCPEHGVLEDKDALQQLEERTACAHCGATCTLVEVGSDDQPVG